MERRPRLLAKNLSTQTELVETPLVLAIERPI